MPKRALGLRGAPFEAEAQHAEEPAPEAAGQPQFALLVPVLLDGRLRGRLLQALHGVLRLGVDGLMLIWLQRWVLGSCWKMYSWCGITLGRCAMEIMLMPRARQDW